MTVTEKIALRIRESKLEDIKKLDDDDLTTVHNLSKIKGAIKAIEKNKKVLLTFFK
jgi:hypothetical protein